eukprot:SM000224S07085  [mRNA]  locus=s224:5698:11291:+ [translate_table: standard]
MGLLAAASPAAAARPQGPDIPLHAAQHVLGRLVPHPAFHFDSVAVSGTHCTIIRARAGGGGSGAGAPEPPDGGSPEQPVVLVRDSRCGALPGVTLPPCDGAAASGLVVVALSRPRRGSAVVRACVPTRRALSCLRSAAAPMARSSTAGGWRSWAPASSCATATSSPWSGPLKAVSTSCATPWSMCAACASPGMPISFAFLESVVSQRAAGKCVACCAMAHLSAAPAAEKAFTYVFRQLEPPPPPAGVPPQAAQSQGKRRAASPEGLACEAEAKRLKVGVAPEDFHRLQQANKELQEQLAKQATTLVELSRGRRSQEQLHAEELRKALEEVNAAHKAELQNLKEELEKKRSERAAEAAELATERLEVQLLRGRAEAAVQACNVAEDAVTRHVAQVAALERALEEDRAQQQAELQEAHVQQEKAMDNLRATAAQNLVRFKEEAVEQQKRQDDCIRTLKCAEASSREAMQRLQSELDLEQQELAKWREQARYLQEQREADAKASLLAIQVRMRVPELLDVSDAAICSCQTGWHSCFFAHPLCVLAIAAVRSALTSKQANRQKLLELASNVLLLLLQALAETKQQLMTLEAELAREQALRSAAEHKVISLEHDAQASTQALELEKQQLRGACERVMLRETQLRAIHAAAVDIVALQQQQHKQLAHMMSALEDTQGHDKVAGEKLLPARESEGLNPYVTAATLVGSLSQGCLPHADGGPDPPQQQAFSSPQPGDSGRADERPTTRSDAPQKSGSHGPSQADGVPNSNEMPHKRQRIEGDEVPAGLRASERSAAIFKLEDTPLVKMVVEPKRPPSAAFSRVLPALDGEDAEMVNDAEMVSDAGGAAPVAAAMQEAGRARQDDLRDCCPARLPEAAAGLEGLHRIAEADEEGEEEVQTVPVPDYGSQVCKDCQMVPEETKDNVNVSGAMEAARAKSTKEVENCHLDEETQDLMLDASHSSEVLERRLPGEGQMPRLTLTLPYESPGKPDDSEEGLGAGPRAVMTETNGIMPSTGIFTCGATDCRRQEAAHEAGACREVSAPGAGAGPSVAADGGLEATERAGGGELGRHCPGGSRVKAAVGSADLLASECAGSWGRSTQGDHNHGDASQHDSGGIPTMERPAAPPEVCAVVEETAAMSEGQRMILLGLPRSTDPPAPLPALRAAHGRRPLGTKRWSLHDLSDSASLEAKCLGNEDFQSCRVLRVRCLKLGILWYSGGEFDLSNEVSRRAVLGVHIRQPKGATLASKKRHPAYALAMDLPCTSATHSFVIYQKAPWQTC